MTQQSTPQSLPFWLRFLLVLGLVLIAAAGAVAAYRFLTKLTTLTVAVSQGSEATAAISAVAGRVSDGRIVRLKVVPTASMTEAADLFDQGKVDLAVVRADMAHKGDPRALAVLAQSVALMFVPPGSSVEDIDGLKGRTIGVIDSAANARVVEAIANSYGLERSKFRPVSKDEAKALLLSRHIQALLLVAPLTERHLTSIRGYLGFKPKQRPGLVAIDQAEAIAGSARFFETFDLPKGTVLGAPPLPDEDLATLRIPINLVAQRRLNNAIVTALTRAIFDVKGELTGKFPVLSQIRAPDTDKDAYIPLHPGAAAYFEGDEQSFFDRYSDALVYGPMIAGAIASLLAGVWRFLGGSGEAVIQPLIALASLFGRVKSAPDGAALDEIEDEIDDLVSDELPNWTGDGDTQESRGFYLGVSRLERAIARRRAGLGREQAGAEVDRQAPAAG